jgi:REP element-mobilizing transposase RayT
VFSPVLASRPVALPEAYFITFACYGAHLHGDPIGSIDRNHNAFRGRYLDEDEIRRAAEQWQMRGESATLDSADRRLVLDAVIGVCEYKRWPLHAAHIRSTHAHVVVTAEDPPEAVMGKFKAYSSRALNRARGCIERRWAYHGRTLYLWRPTDVHAAVEYVYARQGVRMARWVNPVFWPQFGLEDDDETNLSAPHL